MWQEVFQKCSHSWGPCPCPASLGEAEGHNQKGKPGSVSCCWGECTREEFGFPEILSSVKIKHARHHRLGECWVKAKESEQGIILIFKATCRSWRENRLKYGGRREKRKVQWWRETELEQLWRVLRGGGGEKKALYFEILYCPYVESGWKELHVSKGYWAASRDTSSSDKGHLCTRKRVTQKGKLVRRAVWAMNWGKGCLGR